MLNFDRRFFKKYVLDGGYRMGTRGLIRAMMAGFYQFVLVSKIAPMESLLSLGRIWMNMTNTLMREEYSSDSVRHLMKSSAN